MKATGRQRRLLLANGWIYTARLRTWSRPRNQFDLGGLGRRGSLNMHQNESIIHVTSAAQAMIVDAAMKERWNVARQREWPPLW